jgi:hypothetical protein
MTESEISALLDAHDALVKAYIGSSLAFDEFVLPYLRRRSIPLD